MVRINDIIERFPLITPREESSVIRRYTEAFQDDVDEFGNRIDDAKNSHFIDPVGSGSFATGEVEFVVAQGSTTEIPRNTVVATSDGLEYITTASAEVDPIESRAWDNDWQVMEWSTELQTNLLSTKLPVRSRGFGTAFNVGADEITVLVDTVPGVQSVTNPAPLSGGATDDLDEIGKIFGPIGRRDGRGDTAYRAYLKSLVNVFQFRGTVPGIIAAVSVAIGATDPDTTVTEDDVEVYEHFNDDPANPEEYLEYSIELSNWEPHAVSSVEELAELSDASVSRLRQIEYDIATDSAGAADAVSVGQTQKVPEAASAAATVAVDGNTTTVPDTVGIGATLTTDEAAINTSTWGDPGVDWSFFEWTN